MSEQKPCPRCHSSDVKYVPSACLCSDRHSNPCWSYPVCRRCGYSNYGSSANSEGKSWMPFTGVTPMSTVLDGLALLRTVLYDHRVQKPGKRARKIFHALVFGPWDDKGESAPERLMRLLREQLPLTPITWTDERTPLAIIIAASH